MSVSLREKNQTKYGIHRTYKNEPWYRGIIDYIYGKYADLAYRMGETYRYVAPDPSTNRYTHSSEYANIIREAGTIFDSTMRSLINQSGNLENFQCNIHGFLSFLKNFDTYLEERPVLFHENKTHTYIFPFERSVPDDPRPSWWIAYTNLKHNEIEAYREGNFENALSSVAAAAVLSGHIQPRGGAIIFANTGLINRNMERTFPYE